MNTEQQKVRNQIVINMSEQGFSQLEIAKATGITQGRISQLLKSYDSSPDTFFEKNYHGRPQRLVSGQQAQLQELLLKGAVAYGFQADIWTAARIQVVIQETFGINYHVHHIPKLLKKWGFSLQKPRLVDSRQSPEKIEDWREEQLPAIKKKPRKKTE
jgi:transposase